MTIAPEREPETMALPDLTVHGRGTRADKIFRYIALGAGALVLVVLLLIAVVTTQRAWPAFTELGIQLLPRHRVDPLRGRVRDPPPGVGHGARVVHRHRDLRSGQHRDRPLRHGDGATGRLRSFVITVIDVLAAVPSVVFGLWGFFYLIPPFQSAFNWFSDLVSGIPVINAIFGTSTGSSFASAGIVLALMITPIVTVVSREVFLTVPENDRAGALALGATRWEMIRGVVFPHSTGGLTGAVMLGLGRAMGETVAVALLIGAVPRLSVDVFGVGETMPAQIFRNLSEADDLFRAALIGLGVCLFVLTIAINISARKVVVLVDRRTRGDA